MKEIVMTLAPEGLMVQGQVWLAGAFTIQPVDDPWPDTGEWDWLERSDGSGVKAKRADVEGRYLLEEWRFRHSSYFEIKYTGKKWHECAQITPMLEAMRERLYDVGA